MEKSSRLFSVRIGDEILHGMWRCFGNEMFLKEILEMDTGVKKENGQLLLSAFLMCQNPFPDTVLIFIFEIYIFVHF